METNHYGNNKRQGRRMQPSYRLHRRGRVRLSSICSRTSFRDFVSAISVISITKLVDTTLFDKLTTWLRSCTYRAFNRHSSASFFQWFRRWQNSSCGYGRSIWLCLESIIVPILWLRNSLCGSSEVTTLPHIANELHIPHNTTNAYRTRSAKGIGSYRY